MTGAMQPNGQIARREAERGGGVLRRRAIEVDALEHIAILFRQSGQEPLDALAQDSFGSGVGLLWNFCSQPFERTVADIAPPIQVDDGAAQDAVEPSDDIFISSGLAVGAQGFQQALLHDIHGQMRVADALPGESHEGFKIFQKRFFDVRHGGQRSPAPSSQQPGASTAKIECNESAGAALAVVNEDL